MSRVPEAERSGVTSSASPTVSSPKSSRLGKFSHMSERLLPKTVERDPLCYGDPPSGADGSCVPNGSASVESRCSRRLMPKTECINERAEGYVSVAPSGGRVYGTSALHRTKSAHTRAGSQCGNYISYDVVHGARGCGWSPRDAGVSNESETLASGVTQSSSWTLSGAGSPCGTKVAYSMERLQPSGRNDVVAAQSVCRQSASTGSRLLPKSFTPREKSVAVGLGEGRSYQEAPSVTWRTQGTFAVCSGRRRHDLQARSRSPTHKKPKDASPGEVPEYDRGVYMKPRNASTGNTSDDMASTAKDMKPRNATTRMSGKSISGPCNGSKDASNDQDVGPKMKGEKHMQHGMDLAPQGKLPHARGKLAPECPASPPYIGSTVCEYCKSQKQRFCTYCGRQLPLQRRCT